MVDCISSIRNPFFHPYYSSIHGSHFSIHPSTPFLNPYHSSIHPIHSSIPFIYPSYSSIHPSHPSHLSIHPIHPFIHAFNLYFFYVHSIYLKFHIFTHPFTHSTHSLIHPSIFFSLYPINWFITFTNPIPLFTYPIHPPIYLLFIISSS